MNKRIYDKLKELNNNLRIKENKKINREKLRQIISRKVGDFISLDNKISIPIRYKKAGIMGVDGSINTYGGNFPYEVTFFRGLAKNTKLNKNKKNTVILEDVFTPFYPKHRAIIDKMLTDENGKEIMTLENALYKYKKDRLTELELLTAIEGIYQYEPSLIIMDGGFYRFDINTPDLWKELQQLCIKKNVLIVGVIEEVSTHKIAQFIKEDIPYFNKSYDREVLFGLLNPNEWLKVKSDIEIKKGYYTAFGRFSNHPQATGLDFLKEQIDYVEEIVEIIKGLTPVKSRGIPVWLDIVDREVRITRKELEVYINNCFDRDIIEKFLIPNSNRRQY